ncbi:UNVERIFIED_CONTAM: hypothetical protein GTU68_043385 [Idotea baltica]|nr:hypothetical protein [Idotea baltica]
MPILGFTPAVTTSVLVFIGLYQFVTHTRLVGKLGILEKFFVTPSSHRVHHARNEKYLDKNYGHVFIIWDKMMGTFAPEEEEPDFGITTGFESSNPFWAYLHYWVNLYERSKKLDNFADKVKVFIKPPSWAAEGEVLDGGDYEILSDGTRKKYKPKLPFRLQLYVFFNVMFTIGSFIILLVKKGNLSPMAIGFITTIITFSVLAHGGVLEQKKWGINFEYFRLGLILVLIPIALLGNSLAWFWVPAVCLYVFVMTFWFLRMRNYFEDKVELPEIQPVS